MRTSTAKQIRSHAETPAGRIARLWRRPQVSRVRSRIWIVAAIVILAIVPVLGLAMLLGDTAVQLFQTYIDRLMQLL